MGKETLIKSFKIILIAFSIISAFRFLLGCVKSFIYSPYSLDSFNSLKIITSSFLPYAFPFSITFFIFLIMGLSFLILAISLFKNYGIGIIQGVIGFALYIWIHISFFSGFRYPFILAWRSYFPFAFWIIFYVFSIGFLIYFYKKNKLN